MHSSWVQVGLNQTLCNFDPAQLRSQVRNKERPWRFCLSDLFFSFVYFKRYQMPIFGPGTLRLHDQCVMRWPPACCAVWCLFKGSCSVWVHGLVGFSQKHVNILMRIRRRMSKIIGKVKEMKLPLKNFNRIICSRNCLCGYIFSAQNHLSAHSPSDIQSVSD